MFKAKTWSPYISGIIIGLLQIPVFLILGASVGTSASFASVACSILGLGGQSGCFPLLKHWWQLGLVIGIFIGALLSSRMSGAVRESVSPIWSKILNSKSFFYRSIMAFCGGFIFILGARIADGCTSGNGISGIALLSPGSIIVIFSMFVGGAFVSFFYPRV